MLDLEYHVMQFHKVGYAHIPGVVDEAELAELRAATDRLIRNGRTSFRVDTKFGDVVDDEYVTGNKLCRIEYLLDKDPAFIKLLGHPAIIAFAARVFGEPFLLTWEDMLVKQPNDGIRIPAHQDLLYQSNHGLVFSVGIYLDDSWCTPFELIPGTHHFPALTKNELRTLVALNERDFLAVPVRAGDLVIHNVKLIHRSPENLASHYRRTAYFEFRTLTSVLTDSPWSAEWAWARLPYICAAIQERRTATKLRLTDERFHSEFARSDARLWELNLPRPVPHEVNWRVQHDDVLFARECDKEFV